MTKLTNPKMKYKAILKLALLTLAGLAATIQPHAQAAQTSSAIVAARAPLTISAELRQQTFDMVWRTVNEKHFDPTFGGVNWEQVRVKYAPLAAAAKSAKGIEGGEQVPPTSLRLKDKYKWTSYSSYK